MMDLELSIVMPCLNEAETLAVCIQKAKGYLDRSGVAGEILIADNGSTDGSQRIAEANGARVVHVGRRGYGAALLGGISDARGRYVIMGDADDSYDFARLEAFVSKLREGYDLVMGNRFKGGIEPGAMPTLHRYLGNPVLTTIGRILFRSPCGDFHCGLRGFRKEAIEGLDLRTTGMEFASEMVVKATLHGLRIAEVPTVLSPDGRSHPPHLRSWSDGWRHLRFLLMYSPRWLFLYPGLFLFLFGAFILIILGFGPLKIGSIVLDVHTMLFGSMIAMLGIQFVSFAVIAKQFGINQGILPSDPVFDRYQTFMTLEKILFAGAAIFLLGLSGFLGAVYLWKSAHFGPLDYSIAMRWVIPSVTFIASGCQIIITSFLLGVINIRRIERD
jgi:glycosyltransferase involved in cell wall biosynthesis